MVIWCPLNILGHYRVLLTYGFIDLPKIGEIFLPNIINFSFNVYQISYKYLMFTIECKWTALIELWSYSMWIKICMNPTWKKIDKLFPQFWPKIKNKRLFNQMFSNRTHPIWVHEKIHLKICVIFHFTYIYRVFKLF